MSEEEYELRHKLISEEAVRSSSVSYLSHDVSLTASVTVQLQIARVTHGSSAVRHLTGRVADRQAALEVHRQLCQALRDGIAINDKKRILIKETESSA